MNYIKIEYSFMSTKAEISINGEKISSYSDMTALLNQPFHEIEDKILSVFDKEIFDYYEIDLYGTEYQYRTLKYYQEHSEFCQDIVFNRSEANSERQWYCDYILKLAEKYRLQIRDTENVKLYAATEEVLMNVSPEILICGMEEADLGVYSKRSDAINAAMNNAVVLCDKYDFEILNEKKIFYLPQISLNIFISYFKRYCCQVPQLETVINSLKYMRLEETDKIGFDTCLTERPQFYLSGIPATIDVGNEAEISFESFPAESFFVRVRDENILTYKDKIIEAKGKGIGILEIIDSAENLIDTREIEIIQHNYVKEIRIISGCPVLNINDRKWIEVVAIPSDAEDANDLKWEIEDQSIAHVKENGEVIALAEGKTKLRISSKKVIQELGIEVKPIVKELRFRESKICMKPGETVVVECAVFPENASCENLKWSFDNEVIASWSPSYDGRKCRLQAKREHSGKGNLKCTDQKQQVSAVCNVEVVKIKTAGALAGFSIASLIMGFLCMPVFTPLSIILSIIGLSSSEAEGEKKTFKTCLIISVIEIVLVVLAFVISET